MVLTPLSDGCPKVNEAQFSIFLAVIFGLIMILAFFGLFYCFTKGRPWMYFSGVLGRYIPVNPLRWSQYGVIPGGDVNGYAENAKQVKQNRHRQYGYKPSAV